VLADARSSAPLPQLQALTTPPAQVTARNRYIGDQRTIARLYQSEAMVNLMYCLVSFTAGCLG